MANIDNIDNTQNIDNYLVFNVEHGDLILDIYNEINEYCDSMYMDIHNKGNYSKFLNIIYENINIEESLNFIKTVKKNDIIEEQLNYENNINDDYFELN